MRSGSAEAEAAGDGAVKQDETGTEMEIAYANVFDVLTGAMPECPPDPSDREDRLSYVYLSDMTRYVCDRAYPECEVVLRQFSALLEKLFTEGDPDVHDLAHDALENVWARREERTFVAHFFGAATREVWLRVRAGENS